MYGETLTIYYVSPSGNSPSLSPLHHVLRDFVTLSDSSACAAPVCREMPFVV